MKFTVFGIVPLVLVMDSHPLLDSWWHITELSLWLIVNLAITTASLQILATLDSVRKICTKQKDLDRFLVIFQWFQPSLLTFDYMISTAQKGVWHLLTKKFPEETSVYIYGSVVLSVLTNQWDHPCIFVSLARVNKTICLWDCQLIQHHHHQFDMLCNDLIHLQPLSLISHQITVVNHS